MSRLRSAAATLVGGAAALGGLARAKRRGWSPGAESGAEPSLSPEMEAHRACLETGRPVCADVLEAATTGRESSGDPRNCPVRWPRDHGLTRERVQRLGAQLRGGERR